MDADGVIMALADFGRSHPLPPVLWLEDTAGAFGEMDGFGTITMCKSWASVLELQHVPAAGEPMRAETFGEWNVRIRCDELAYRCISLSAGRPGHRKLMAWATSS